MSGAGENATYITPGDLPKAWRAGPVKPTLLAFHGSGSNSTVHTVQLARLMRVIKEHFNVESLEAPFPSPAGPGVLPFFDGCGPFKRWLPPTEKITLDDMRHGRASNDMKPEVETLVRSTVQKIRSEGGRVVGLIGFSQGTKVVAGLLRAAEIRKELGIQGEDWLDFKVAVSVCGSYPPPLFPPCITSKLSDEQKSELLQSRISTPTFHVLGTQDEWVWASKGLVDTFYEAGEGKSKVVEWDMGHHYPVAPEQNEEIGKWMFEVMSRAEGEGVEGR